jgi:hypothetical protein
MIKVNRVVLVLSMLVTIPFLTIGLQDGTLLGFVRSMGATIVSYWFFMALILANEPE